MNNNITEDYCSFEISKLLKEKGFDAPNCKYWNHSHMTGSETVTLSMFLNEHIKSVKAPTHALAIKWIRENFNISIEIGYRCFDDGCWDYYISKIELSEETKSLSGNELLNFKTPEEAIEAALLYTLKHLI